MNDDQPCRWRGTDQPRAIVGRHDWDCNDVDCRGCEPCTRSHCRVCGREHAAGACPGCVGAVREDLGEILRLCLALPEEVENRGVNGEAFNLLGPVANAEAWGHRSASILSGRIVPMDCDATELEDVRAWLEKADSERHPLWTVATWSMLYRDAFEHDEPTGAVVLANEVGYLDRNLTYAATFVDVPFEDFARDVRASVAHLEQVTGDAERGERTNIDCLDCGAPLERKLGPRGFDDRATCRGCKRLYTGTEYALAVKRKYIDEAEWLSDGDMAVRTGVNADTVRSWGRKPKDDSPPLVRKMTQDGRVVFNVEDVQRVARDKGLAA